MAWFCQNVADERVAKVMGQGDDALDAFFLDVALGEARKGLAEGGIPIGACLMVEEPAGTKSTLASGRNKRVQEKSAIKHGAWVTKQADYRMDVC